VLVEVLVGALVAVGVGGIGVSVGGNDVLVGDGNVGGIVGVAVGVMGHGVGVDVPPALPQPASNTMRSSNSNKIHFLFLLLFRCFRRRWLLLSGGHACQTTTPLKVIHRPLAGSKYLPRLKISPVLQS
jgi:hypothetical protein